MKTVIASESNKMASDFIQSKEFTIASGSGYDLSIDTISYQDEPNSNDLSTRLNELGVTRVLATNIDPVTIKALEAHGMQVFYGASGSIEDGLNLIRLGILDNIANNSCNSSADGCGGCGGGCGCGGK